MIASAAGAGAGRRAEAEEARVDSRRRPCKIGLFVPHFEHPWSGRGPRWAEIAAIARRAEEVGFDSFWLPDHLLFRFAHVHQQGGWDAWSLLAALAARTE